MITCTSYIHSVTQLSLLTLSQHPHSAHIAVAKDTDDFLVGAACWRKPLFSFFIQVNPY